MNKVRELLNKLKQKALELLDKVKELLGLNADLPPCEPALKYDMGQEYKEALSGGDYSSYPQLQVTKPEYTYVLAAVAQGMGIVDKKSLKKSKPKKSKKSNKKSVKKASKKSKKK